MSDRARSELHLADPFDLGDSLDTTGDPKLSRMELFGVNCSALRGAAAARIAALFATSGVGVPSSSSSCRASHSLAPSIGCSDFFRAATGAGVFLGVGESTLMARGEGVASAASIVMTTSTSFSDAEGDVDGGGEPWSSFPPTSTVLIDLVVVFCFDARRQ